VKTTKRLPISTVNIALAGTLLAGAIATALAHNWFASFVFVAGGVAGVGAALYARRPSSRDITRLNAIEYRDERDRLLAKQGFAAVGAAALILSFLEFVLALIFDQIVDLAAAQVVILCIVWAIANSIAVRRS